MGPTCKTCRRRDLYAVAAIFPRYDELLHRAAYSRGAQTLVYKRKNGQQSANGGSGETDETEEDQ
tara:strand:- start:296 stop:490 length:195 start_codon:yes stop_codon:yes gene_type:complete